MKHDSGTPAARAWGCLGAMRGSRCHRVTMGKAHLGHRICEGIRFQILAFSPQLIKCMAEVRPPSSGLKSRPVDLNCAREGARH